jgi:hypothetical protein
LRETIATAKKSEKNSSIRKIVAVGFESAEMFAAKFAST